MYVLWVLSIRFLHYILLDLRRSNAAFLLLPDIPLASNWLSPDPSNLLPHSSNIHFCRSVQRDPLDTLALTCPTEYVGRGEAEGPGIYDLQGTEIWERFLHVTVSSEISERVLPTGAEERCRFRHPGEVQVRVDDGGLSEPWTRSRKSRG